ncbi:DinB family protein [Halalkalibacterium halodurans]|uniref:BH2001 protein n=1 Tax=Halalkalibacterium halodurans (strain ATCC BAA-125 / DSM 18197 / FERM 7344 / JCM 9153 / C-125) TaxID=272558 RepID=Q9KBC7_HALH5|nr:DinB family protein [Halalkalibacterium halodurans]MDY7222560.1 DinB family protein [Halalkalibacterium halodurans]MDY7241781.1 DinB family protein [Halalkalibacterium halodurans]MED4123965.1 DinB family protein [Halalkalibacterium halodurans]BAB05720.1 BH2001 [Halalkalibacterium halodurans C-125]
MSQAHHYQSQLRSEITQLVQIVQPLSEEDIYWKPSHEEWSVMEILCHVEEMLFYWADEFVRVVEARGAEWGRGLQDEARLKAVSRAKERELTDVIDGILKAGHHAETQLASLSDEDLALQAPHRNPKFGVKPMSFLVEHFIIEHVQGHIRQIERTLEKRAQ